MDSVHTARVTTQPRTCRAGQAADVPPTRLIHPPRTADDRPPQPGANPHRSTSPTWPCSRAADRRQALAPRRAAEGQRQLAWEQHMVHHLAPAGVAGFVLANGSMSSSQSDRIGPRPQRCRGVPGDRRARGWVPLHGPGRADRHPRIASATDALMGPAATPGAAAAAATPACHDVRRRSASRKRRLPARGR